MKRRELERHLRDRGCIFDHRGGNHDIWVNVETGRAAAVPRHTSVKTGTAKGICRGLGIDEISIR